MASCQNLGTISKIELNQLYTKIKILGSGSAGTVFQVLRNSDQSVCALKISKDGDLQEIEPSCNYGYLAKWTEGLINIYEYGIIEDKEYLFYTMPILQRLPIMSSIEQLDFLFELLYTVVILTKNGILHNDLNSDNILIKPVSYKRQYIVNGRRFIVNNKIAPVIIDFGEVTITEPLSKFSGDTLWKLVGDEDMEYSLEEIIGDENILNAITDKLRNNDSFEILLDSMFESLRQRDVDAGDLIKIFEPITL